MLIAMGIAAFLCVFIGSYPAPLYAILPFEDVVYKPYNYSHVMSQTQLLFFSALAFTLLLRAGIYPAEIRAINLDADWFYRKGGKLFYVLVDKIFNGINQAADLIFIQGFVPAIARFTRNGPAHLANMVMTPIWMMTLDREAREKEKAHLYRNFSTGTMGLAIMTLFVALFFGLLFFLSL